MMAKTEENVQGRMGNIVFYRVGNETRVRSMARDYQDPCSLKQQQGRSRMRVATRFYQRLAGTPLREAWSVAMRGMSGSGFNLFMKLNMNVFGVDGGILDFSRLLLTVGMLQGVNHLTKTVDGEDRLTLTWEDGDGLPSAREEDRLMVAVLYGNRSFTPVLIEDIGAVRRDRRAVFRLDRKKGTAAHVYCFFGEKEGRAYSTSQYLRI